MINANAARGRTAANVERPRRQFSERDVMAPALRGFGTILRTSADNSPPLSGAPFVREFAASETQRRSKRLNRDKGSA